MILGSRPAATTRARRSSTRDGERARERRLLAGRARPLRRRRARDRLAPPPRAGQRGGRRRTGARRSDPRRRRADRRHAGSRAGRRAARRASPPPRRSQPPGGSGSSPVDHLQGHVAANFLAPEPFEPPFLCLIASGGHTLLARVRDQHGLEVHGPHAGRRRGRGVRQGRPPARPGLSRRTCALAAGRRGRPRRPSRSRPRRASRAWTSPSRASRRRCCTKSASSGSPRRVGAPPTWRRPTSTRSSRR